MPSTRCLKRALLKALLDALGCESCCALLLKALQLLRALLKALQLLLALT
jgi:hypothetical protein